MKKILIIWFLLFNILTLKSQVCIFNENGIQPNGSHNQIGVTYNNLVKSFGVYFSNGGNCFDRVLGIDESFIITENGLMNVTTKYSMSNVGLTYTSKNSNVVYRLGVGVVNTNQNGYYVFKDNSKVSITNTETNFNFALEYKFLKNNWASIGYNTKGSINIGVGFPLSEIKNWKSWCSEFSNSSSTHGSHQCTGTTQAGNRCKRMTTNSNRRCYQH
jgi:hypothetical protein